MIPPRPAGALHYIAVWHPLTTIRIPCIPSSAVIFPYRAISIFPANLPFPGTLAELADRTKKIPEDTKIHVKEKFWSRFRFIRFRYITGLIDPASNNRVTGEIMFKCPGVQ